VVTVELRWGLSEAWYVEQHAALASELETHGVHVAVPPPEDSALTKTGVALPQLADVTIRLTQIAAEVGHDALVAVIVAAATKTLTGRRRGRPEDGQRRTLAVLDAHDNVLTRVELPAGTNVS
jgi:hypothetical protein